MITKSRKNLQPSPPTSPPAHMPTSPPTSAPTTWEATSAPATLSPVNLTKSQPNSPPTRKGKTRLNSRLISRLLKDGGCVLRSHNNNPTEHRGSDTHTRCKIEVQTSPEVHVEVQTMVN